jgi:uncharacterized repeat protein (TIGR02543 family)
MKSQLPCILFLTAAVLAPQAAMAQVNPDFDGRAKLAMDAFKAYSAEEQNARMGAIAAAARLKANDGNDPAMINYIASYYDNRNPGDPGDWTSLSSVAWVVGKYRDKFTPAQLENLKTRVKGLSNLLSKGTENHTLNYQVAGYLFAQHWPNETGWHGGRTSTQLMDATRANLRNIISSLYSKGHHENLSTTYIATHLSPYFILYDCATDPEMKKAADAAITFHVSLIAANHFEGVVLPPFNRQNAPQFNQHMGATWNPVLQWTYWLYWGEVQNRVPTTSNFISNRENRWFIHAALSDWRPPAAINSLAFGRTVPYELTSTKSNLEHFGAGGAGEYERYVYRDRLFAMGSGNMRFRPNGVHVDYNMSGLIYKSTDTFNYIDFHHDYWRSNNRIWSGASPFIQMAQHKGTAIVLFNIPATDPWRERGPVEYQILRNNYYDSLIQEAMVRYPKAIDQMVEAGGWIFLREGDVYIAIRPLKAYTIDGSYNNSMVMYPSDSDESHLNSFVDTMAHFDVVRSAHAQTGFVLDVGTKERFESFEAFQSAVQQNPPTVNWSNLSVSYRNVEGNTLSSTWRAPQPDYKDVPSSYGNNINAQVWVRPTYTVNGTVVPLDTDFTGAKAVIKSNSIRLVDRLLQLTTPEGYLSVNWSGSSPVFTNAQTYPVTYHVNNATSGTAPADQTKVYDVALTLAANSGNLARTGYTFEGWNTAANGSGINYPATYSYAGNAGLGLFAKWLPVSAGTLHWDNAGGTVNDWSSTANWSTRIGGGSTPSAIPGASHVAAFSATPVQGIAQTVNLNANRSLLGLAVVPGVTAKTTLRGGGTNRTLRIGGLGISHAGVANLAIGSETSGQQVAITFAGSQGIAANHSGGISIINNMSGAGTPTITNNGTGAGLTILAGALQSTIGRLVQDSFTSVLSLRGNNINFNGSVEIIKGTLAIGFHPNNLGNASSGLVILGGSGAEDATMQISHPSSVTHVAKPIVLGATTGTLKILLRDESGTNTQTLTGGITGSNNLVLENRANGLNADDKLVFSTGALNNAGSITHIGDSQGVLIINSVIGSNVTRVVQDSVGCRLVLRGANTYTGDTIVSAGTLVVNGNAIPDSGKLFINSGGKVSPSGATETVSTLFFDGVQQAAGTWGSSSSTANNKDDSRFTGAGVVLVTSGPATETFTTTRLGQSSSGSDYSSWAAASGAGPKLNDDHDNDGVANGVEWFLGGSSDTTGFTAQPGITHADGVFSITWTKAADYPGTYGDHFHVETSDTPTGNWTVEGPGGNIRTSTDGSSCTYIFPAGAGKKFARLVVTGP